MKPSSSLRASAPELGSLLHNSQQNQLLTFKAAASSAAGADASSTPPAAGPKLFSHRIAISPIERSAQTPDSLSAAADTVRQDNADTPRKADAAAAGVSSFSELLAKQQAETADGKNDTQQLAGTDAAAGADVAAKPNSYAAAEGKSAQKKHSKVPAGTTSSSGKGAHAMKTPPSSRKTSSAGGAAQTPPVYHHTPRSMAMGASPSPSVARPTCASMSRAQAVAASMPTAAGAGGHWKL
jgi:hypothetical protein